jgi:hypothetical protein
LEKYPEEPGTTKFIENFNIFFLCYYLTEVILKLVPMGWNLFAFDRYNLFDLFIVLISLVDVVIVNSSNHESVATTAFRGLRLMRVFKLAKTWHTF